MSTEILQERSDRFDVLSHELPYGFVASMAEYGEEALRIWLKKNAPAEVYELFDKTLCLQIEANDRLLGRRLSRPDSSLLEYIAQVARTANDLGATWYGADGGAFLMRGAGEPPFADDEEETTQAEQACEPVTA